MKESKKQGKKDLSQAKTKLNRQELLKTLPDVYSKLSGKTFIMDSVNYGKSVCQILLRVKDLHKKPLLYLRNNTHAVYVSSLTPDDPKNPSFFLFDEAKGKGKDLVHIASWQLVLDDDLVKVERID